MIEYQVKYSSRKTLNITVERDRSVVVHAPNGFSEEKIGKVILSKQDWINSKISNSKKYSQIPQRKEFVNGESLLFLGKLYNLTISAEDFDGIIFDNGFFISEKNQKQANGYFKNWYKEQALLTITKLSELYAEKLGVKYNQLKLTDMKYRWGSCSPKGNININWRIIKAPMFVIEYLVVHELSHLLEANHSDKFWNMVSIQVPQYESAKEWLRNNGGLLEIDF